MIEIRNVSKSFEKQKILNNINLVIDDNSITCLIGESGCGKTTLLKMINRLYEPTKGTILINHKNIFKEDIIKLRRSIGYVIQHTGLFPHMTIKENIELIPKLSHLPKEKIEKRTEELMNLINLNPSEFLNRYPR